MFTVLLSFSSNVVNNYCCLLRTSIINVLLHQETGAKEVFAKPTFNVLLFMKKKSHSFVMLHKYEVLSGNKF